MPMIDVYAAVGTFPDRHPLPQAAGGSLRTPTPTPTLPRPPVPRSHVRERRSAADYDLQRKESVMAVSTGSPIRKGTRMQFWVTERRGAVEVATFSNPRTTI